MDTQLYAPRASRRRRLSWSRFGELSLIPPLCVIALLFQITSGGQFLSAGNITVLLHQSSITAVLAAGLTFVVISGGIDLSISSILAASAVAGIAFSNTSMANADWIVAPLLIGTLIGLINGIVISRLAVPPFLFTLASLTVILGLTRMYTGDLTIYNNNLMFSDIATSSIIGLPVFAYIAAAFILLSWLVLRYTTFGLYVYAIGCNYKATSLSGINVKYVTMSCYGVAGLSAGISAVMLMCKLHGANALQIGQSYTLDAIAAVIIGGTSFAGGIGSVLGSALGTAMIVVISNGLILSGVPDMWQGVFKGFIIITAVVLDRARNSSVGV